MNQLKLFLLGAPRLEWDGKPVETDTRKAVALLSYLAVTGEEHTREALAALLWPEFDESRARAALRRTLSAMKKGVGAKAVMANRESIALNAQHVWLDVNQFSTLATSPDVASLHLAVSLYRGDFLSGFTLRDAPPFDEWQFYQSEGLREQMAQLLERLAGMEAAQGEFAAATTAAQRWLAMDPLREEAHRALMRIYAWSGRRSAALQQYRECRRVLEAELGVPPLEETTALYHLIQEDQLERPPVDATIEPRTAEGDVADRLPERGGITAMPLVGRRLEMEQLSRCFAQVGPDGRLLTLIGEAGIGKTRLANEFLEQLKQQKSNVVTTVCYEGETNLAYAPLVQAIRASLADGSALSRLTSVTPLWLAEGARLVPELANLMPGIPTAPALQGPGGRGRLLSGISEILSALCAGAKPGVVFIDDAQWADQASLEMVAFMARRMRQRPILILMSWRQDDSPQSEQLRRLLAEGDRSGWGRSIPLGRLSRGEVAELLAATTYPSQQDLAQRLFQETEGLPHFVVEYLAAIGRQTEDLTRLLEETPRNVRELLLARVASASQTGRQLLQTAAAIGHAFDVTLLLAASGRSEEEAVNGLEELVRLDLIRESEGRETSPSYDFTHGKLRSLVYEETSLVRRRLLHKRLALGLVEQATRNRRPDSVAGQIATHYQLAGMDDEAAAYLEQAGRHAQSLFANREALQYYETALALGHPNTAWLHEACGDLHVRLGEYQRAINSYETAASHASEEALAGLELKLGQVYHRRGDYELAERQFEVTRQKWEQDQDVIAGARLFAEWSTLAFQQQEMARAEAMAQQALGLAESSGHDIALAQAYNVLGMLERRRGDLSKAESVLARSLEIAETSSQPEAQVAALNNLAFIDRARGDLERAGERLEQALQLCRTYGDRHREAALLNNLADLHHRAERPEEAMARLKQAVAIYAEMDPGVSEWQPEIWKLTEW